MQIKGPKYAIFGAQQEPTSSSQKGYETKLTINLTKSKFSYFDVNTQ
jgi:hypothetical protein